MASVALMQNGKAVLCTRGAESQRCRDGGCNYAHSLNELAIGPMHEQEGYAKGMFCRFIGQEVALEAHRAIKDYYWHAIHRGQFIPPWAHCYLWSHLGWPIDFRPDLGEFNIRQDYDLWVWEGAKDAVSGAPNPQARYHPFPIWLSDRLSERRHMLQGYRIYDAVVAASAHAHEPTRPMVPPMLYAGTQPEEEQVELDRICLAAWTPMHLSPISEDDAQSIYATQATPIPEVDEESIYRTEEATAAIPTPNSASGSTMR